MNLNIIFMKTKFKTILTAVLSLSLFYVNTTNAQEATASSTPKGEIPVKSGWNFLIEPYIMFPNMSGDVGLANLPDVTIDADPSDIFSNLKMGAMLYLEASNEKWNINSDLLYMDLSQGVESGVVINNGEVSAKQLGWEVAGLYKVKPYLEVGVGGLLNSIKSDVNINLNQIGGGTNNRYKALTETWFDPMIVAVFKSVPGKKFIYTIRGEIGGFGVGSDLAWQVQAYAGYRFSKLFQLTGGYRAIGLDYENGSGRDRFVYNVVTYGPVVRFGFNL